MVKDMLWLKNEFEKVMNTIPQMGYGLIIAHSDELNDEKNGSQ